MRIIQSETDRQTEVFNNYLKKICCVENVKITFHKSFFILFNTLSKHFKVVQLILHQT